jgi:hypothetical protein
MAAPRSTIPAIAITDTGVAAERLPGGTIVNGVNLSGDGPPDDTTDENGHGTSIAASILRVAPWAPIVPVKLICKYGYLRAPEQLEAAFEWVAAHRARFAIGVVCAPFADGSHLTSDESFRGSQLQQQLAALRRDGVPTVAPAGNRYRAHRLWSDQGMAWPAILREVISVGAARRAIDGLRLTEMTQRLHASVGGACGTTVFVEPDQPGDTSGATAVVAAHLLRLRAADPSVTVEDLVERLLGERCRASDGSACSWPALGMAARLAMPSAAEPDLRNYGLW